MNAGLASGTTRSSNHVSGSRVIRNRGSSPFERRSCATTVNPWVPGSSSRSGSPNCRMNGGLGGNAWALILAPKPQVGFLPKGANARSRRPCETASAPDVETVY